MGRTIELTASDGHRLSAYLAEPQGRPRGGIVVLQEIFGVNAHIRSVADGYATDGYRVVAPAMFDRVSQGYETGYTQPDIQAGLELKNKLDWDNAMLDIGTAVGDAASAGKVGIVGYCWGGTAAWIAAARVPGLAASVPHYGGGIPDFIDEQPKCPVMFQFGEADKTPTPEQARAVVAAHPETTANFYPGGHGFNCDQRPSYHAESARLAREKTLAFFRRHIG